jgi:hypothetical protein
VVSLIDRHPLSPETALNIKNIPTGAGDDIKVDATTVFFLLVLCH